MRKSVWDLLPHIWALLIPLKPPAPYYRGTMELIKAKGPEEREK